MHIGFNGKLSDERRVRAAFIGCGSHAFRNVYPALQFAPVELVATCDLDVDKARAYARQFGAADAYGDPEELFRRDDIEAVFIVTNYDEQGRPRYPDLTCRALAAGKHVWIEKPPAATCADIERMQAAAAEHGRHVVVGLKKMFAPANRKAAELSRRSDFGAVSMISIQYPQSIPEADVLKRYLTGESVQKAVEFLDHLCHPMSLLVMLHGMPRDLIYQRSRHGAGAVTFTYDDGVVATLALTHGAAKNGGMERTMIVSDSGRHILVENNTRLSYHRNPNGLRYGMSPDYFLGEPEEVTGVWQPECSLGQLYNKGLFLLGYWAEVQAFVESARDNRPPSLGTLEQAWQVTRVFEAFAEGPGRLVQLDSQPSHKERTR